MAGRTRSSWEREPPLSDQLASGSLAVGVRVQSPDLLLVCLTALTAVFALLGVLALLMRGLMVLLPAAPALASAPADPAIVAAISTAAAAAYPGATITRIEEAP